MVGVDPGTTFVEQARALGEPVPNLSFVVADVHELPFADGATRLRQGGAAGPTLG